jgi:hypothetical protein
VAASAELGLHALVRSTSSRLPAINDNPQLGSVAGVLGGILFNFGFVTTVPSWLEIACKCSPRRHTPPFPQVRHHGPLVAE